MRNAPAISKRSENMSASNEWTEWHLTPRGWECGTEKIDSAPTSPVPPPTDRVLTCRYHEFLGSIHSKVQRSVDEVWRGTDEVTVASLLTKFGICPERL